MGHPVFLNISINRAAVIFFCFENALIYGCLRNTNITNCTLYSVQCTLYSLVQNIHWSLSVLPTSAVQYLD